MASLPEDETWEPGIYQFETEDPVIGGPSGLDNLPTKQLASRTKYLKAAIETHAAASDPHPQYLSAAEGALAFDQINAAALAISDHAGASDPHIAYVNVQRGDLRYAQKDHGHTAYETAGSVASHAGASDPHPQYLNQSEGDARYELAGANSTGLNNHINGDKHFAAGTRLLFAQAAAPVGWSQIITDAADNRMLRVVKTAGYGTGGTHSPILNSVVASHTHGFTSGGQSSNHTHNGWTASENANHTHNVITYGANDFNASSAVTGTDDTYSGPFSVSGTDGVSNNHQHWYETSGYSSDHSHSGSTDNGSSQTNWQPRYIDLILCQKS